VVLHSLARSFFLENRRPYNEQNFKDYFVTTKIYNRIQNDFTEITWTKHCDMYRLITPRQFLGDSTTNVFSVPPFYYLQYLLEVNPTRIYDIGCGWNIFKKYIPNIIGVAAEDPTSKYYYGDVHGMVDDAFVSAHQNFFESAFSINALHFVPLKTLRQQVIDFVSMLSPGGRGFVTFNLQRLIERSTDEFLIDTFKTLRPTRQQYDQYVRDQLDRLPCEMIVFDVGIIECINDVMEGNIRLVLEKESTQN
jgi:hypothetical protein